MVSKTEIPNHWGWKKLGDLVNVNPRYDLPDQNDFPYVPMKKVSAENKEITGFERKDNIYSGLSKFKNGDILFARITPCTENGKAAFVEYLPDGEELAVGSSELAVLSPGDELKPRYLYYLIQEPSLRNKAINQMKGASGRKRVPYSFFREDIEVPVPPLEEQEAIVQKLDKIFEDIGEIENAQEQAEQIYQDIAFSFFTSRVRDAETDNVETDELIESTQYGSSNATNSEGDGYPSLRMGNYNLRGEMDYSKIKYQEFEDGGSDKYKLEKGDVLFNRTNSADLVGKMCIYDGGLEKAVFASYLIRVELKEDKVLPEYFVTYMNSPLGEVERKGKLKQAVSQANINATELREMEMAVPSLEKQEEIVKSLKYMRSKVDGIKAEVKRKGELIEDIPNSVLAEAFKGNLVDSEVGNVSNESASRDQVVIESEGSDVEGQQSLEEFR